MDENSLPTSFWVMVVIQSLGSIDMPGNGPRKMPAPRQYVAIVVTWLVLQFIAGVHRGAARATAMIGWVLVLTGIVLGPFGKQVVSLFGNVGTNFNPTANTAFTDAAAKLGGVSPSQVSSLTPFPASSSQ